VRFGSENLHSVLQCVAARCNVLHCVAVHIDDHDFREFAPSVLQRVAVCKSKKRKKT